MIERKASYTRGALDEIAKNKSISDIEKINQIIDVYISKLFTYRKFHRCMHQELMLSKRESIQQTIVNVIYPNSVIIRDIIEAGIKKGSFRKVDAPLVIATLVGTINQVLLSKKMCNKLLNKDDDYIPYNDEKFIKRVSTHLKELMHNYLLK